MVMKRKYLQSLQSWLSGIDDQILSKIAIVQKTLEADRNKNLPVFSFFFMLIFEEIYQTNVEPQKRFTVLLV